MKRTLLLVVILIAPIILSLLLIFSVEKALAAIPIIDDEDGLVSRQEVYDYYESMYAREATRDKYYLEKVYDVLDHILETHTTENPYKNN